MTRLYAYINSALSPAHHYFLFLRYTRVCPILFCHFFFSFKTVFYRYFSITTVGGCNRFFSFPNSFLSFSLFRIHSFHFYYYVFVIIQFIIFFYLWISILLTTVFLTTVGGLVHRLYSKSL